MKKIVLALFALLVALSGCAADNSSDMPVPKKLIPFTAVSQYPELPTGCEVTSLAMVLHYYGINIDKCEIGDRYLDKGEAGAVSYFEAFEGDPRDEDSYGCYAPVIVKAANRILKEKASELKAEEVTGGRLGSLFEYIDKDIPVIIWGTQNCQSGYISGQWRVDEQEFTWISPEHCMVLVGYSDSSVWVADPIHGDVREFDINTFEPCYNLLHKQAVVIR